MKNKNVNNVDVLIIGGGIMSATLATLLSELYKNDLKIKIIEKLNGCGLESSEGLNNAGTGHAGNCELNYTPEINGSVDISKAISIAEKFELSLQFWAYIIKKDKKITSNDFIIKSPHASFVWKIKDIQFLKKRYQALKKEPLFNKIKLLTSLNDIKKIFPLLTENRIKDQNVAMTIYDQGTDINFGQLTRILVKRLLINRKITLKLNENVTNIKKINNEYIVESTTEINRTKFLFIGSGGSVIKLLQNLNLKSSKGYAGFPISGKWLICKNKSIVKQHFGKVYSQAETGAPPMSVPHLDIRKIKNKNYLLFGPFAGFTFKFLKNGSFFDFPKSIKLNNIKEIISVCFLNPKLVMYLFKQIILGKKAKMNHLKKFYPNAKDEDWYIYDAGQRVQIIKPLNSMIGKLEFGTEIVYDEKLQMAALLGASPGASVSAASMLEIIEKCFVKDNSTLKNKLKKIFPSYGIKLNENPKLLKKIRSYYQEILKIS